MKLIHHSPLGELDIPEVAGPVRAGDVFDVPDDIAASLLEQGDVFTRAPKESEK